MPTPKPNILFIMTDQQRFDTIASLGNTRIYTPNMDRLVRRGLTFTQAYSTCPVCMAARYTIRTGCEPPLTRIFENRRLPPVPGQAATMEGRCGPYLARTMTGLGYRTFGIGKFHSGPWNEDLGYEYQTHSEEMYKSPEQRAGDGFASWIATEQPAFAHIEALMGERTEMYYMPQVSPLPAELTVEHWAADRAVEQLAVTDDRPYFGFISFIGPLPAGAEPPALSARWEPSITPEAYEAGIARIKDWIARGETYQVNYTFALRSAFSGDPAALFLRWHRAQRPRYGAFLQWKDHAVCSVSPELFFALDGDVLTCRPMKGTTPRGLTWTDDEARAVQLQHSLKNRAENIMIVDMMRNDLGRIARPGSVIAGPLFQIERYPTLLQMTSTVRARTGAGFPAIMRALFPSSSITGAPKIRTMELIRRLEPEPRNLYTGTIGALLPSHPFKANAQRWAQFNVAIRTVLIDTARKRAHYGTGGGIVWDSNTTDEFEECRTKALVLTTPPVQCALLETILWKPGSGGFLLNDHIERLAASARYFDFPFSRQRFLTAWHNATHSLPHARHRVRMTLDESGTFQVECTRLPQGRGVMRVAWDDQPVSSQDRMLYHKTTCRDRYRPACARHPEADDVLLWNERGEVTEFTMANLLIQRDGVWFTPPVSSGLLDGVLRRTLIRRGRVREEVILRSELETAQQILWINSLRGFRRIQMVAYSAPQEPSATNQRGGV